MRPMAEEPTLLQLAFKALSAKAQPYATRWAYYDGEHPLRYANPNLQSKFAKLVEHYTANWCKVVVDTLLERMDLTGLAHSEEVLADRLGELWQALGMDLEADEVHRALAVCGEAYLIADQLDDGSTVYFANPPELCHVAYLHTNPKERAWAAKWWVDEETEKRYLTIYQSDHFEHYVSKGKASEVQDARGLEPDPEQPVAANPWAPVVPVFHYRLSRRRSDGEVRPVIDTNDAYNKLFADMMVAAEYGAMKQRFIVSNADVASLKNAPDEVWEIPAGGEGEHPTQVGEFQATELRNFTDAMDTLSSKVAVLTRTPKHYLHHTGAEPSGEALMAMEAPLVKKAKAYQRAADATWREVGQFMLALEGTQTPRDSVAVVWEDARTLQPIAQGEARKLAVEAGIPLALWLKFAEGWTDDQLAELEAATAVAAEQQTMSAGEAMYRALQASQAEEPGAMEVRNATPAVPARQ